MRHPALPESPLSLPRVCVAVSAESSSSLVCHPNKKGAACNMRRLESTTTGTALLALGNRHSQAGRLGHQPADTTCWEMGWGKGKSGWDAVTQLNRQGN